MSNFPDDFNDSAFAAVMGETPRALAHENAVDRQFNDLLHQLTDDTLRPGTQLTKGQDYINDVIAEEELDGTIYAAIKAAALHLRNCKSMTAEQVGQLLIDSLSRDLMAIAERDADAGERF